MADLHLPSMFVGVAFNAEPFDPAAVPTWSDLSSRCVAISSAARGRQYELDQNETGSMNVTWVNIDEALNPVNTGGPYYPNVQPYRAILARCMWPNGGTGNLMNLAYNNTDGSFDSYADGGPIPSWLLPIGAPSGSGVTAGFALAGECIFYVIATSAVAQGLSWVVPCIPGRQYTSSVYVRNTVVANVQQISVVGGAAGTTTATIGAYVRLTVTFTATQPTHTVQIVTVGAHTTDTVRIDQVQHEPGGAATTFTTSGPLIRNIWTRGYVERWPVQWDETGFEGQSSTPCVGPFAILQNADLRTAYRDAVIGKGPQYFWMLAEASGATTFIDSSGNSGPSLLTQISPAGPGTLPAAGVADLLPGDPSGTGVQFIEGVPTGGGVIGSILGTGACFPGTPYAAFPSTATGGSWSATFTGWMRVTYPLLGGATLFRSTIPGSSALTAWTCSVFAFVTGQIQVAINGGTGTLASAISAGNVFNDGKFHHIAATLTQVVGGNSSVAVYVDGVSVATGTTLTTNTGLITTPANSVMVGGRSDGVGNYAAMPPAIMSMIGLFNRALSVAEITDLYQASRGYAGELESTRIARYLTLGGYVGPTAIGTGASVMGASTVKQGDAVLASCQQASNSAFGNFYESGDGIAYASRNARYLTTAASYTFGENVAGGEYPYTGEILFDFDPQLVLNIADVTRTGGLVAHAEDPTGFSQKRFGKKNFTRTIDIASDNEAIDAATWTVSNRKAPLMRVASVTFDPAATRIPGGDGTLWPMLLTLEIGTRVTVKRRPKSANAGAGITMSGDFFVEKIDHHDINFETGTWLTTLQLSPVNIAQPWILQDAVYGQLGITTVLGF